MAQVNIMSSHQAPAYQDMAPPHGEDYQQPVPPAANLSGPFHHNLPPQTHYNVLSKLSDFSHEGSLSAPAVPDSSDDYFSFLVSNQDPASLFPLLQQLQPEYQHPQHNQSQHQHQHNQHQHQHQQQNQYLRPDYKQHVRSKLSQTFTQDELEKPPKQKLKMQNRNPGFRLNLDSRPSNPVAKFQSQQQVPVLPSLLPSESSFDVNYSNMKLQEPDLVFNQNGFDWDLAQENITPLMNPPDTNAELGYFGAYDSNYTDLDLPAGNIDTKTNDDAFLFPKNENHDDLDMAHSNTDGFVPVHESFVEYQSYDQQNDSYQYPQQHQSQQLNQQVYGYPRNDVYDYKTYQNKPKQSEQYHEQYQMPSPPRETNSLFEKMERPNVEKSMLAQTVGNEAKPNPEKRKRRGVKVSICPICDRHITRDYSRHMRIHNEIGRFQCVFPRGTCSHKSGKFNRPYDYKKHLLNVHFRFDDPKIKLAPNLTDKLQVPGTCVACGQRFLGIDWLEKHVLTADAPSRCVELQKHHPVKPGYLDDFEDGFRSE